MLKSSGCNNIAVIGSDKESFNIALCMAAAGQNVCLLCDNKEKALSLIGAITENIATYKGKENYDPDVILKHISTFDNLSQAVCGADLIIDTIWENAGEKKKTIADITALMKEDAILACNSQVINIYDNPKAKDMSRVMIAHFSEPSYIIKTVEIATGEQTSKEAVSALTSFLESIGKICVYSKPVPGLIVERMHQALMREFNYMVSKNWVSPPEVDSAVAAHYGIRTSFEGIFDLTDQSGVDILKNMASLMGNELCASKTVSGEIFDLYIKQGRLGFESSCGFYDYESPLDAVTKRDSALLCMCDEIDNVNEKLKDRKSGKVCPAASPEDSNCPSSSANSGIRLIAVLGSGTMGTNIAFTLAINGLKVHLYDINPQAIKRAFIQMESNLKVFRELGITDKDFEYIKSNISVFDNLKDAVQDADFVWEAVYEDVEVKKETFSKLSLYCRPDTILASNTSTLNIFEFIEVENPARTVIVHIGGPGHIMKAAEIVKGPCTSGETLDVCSRLMLQIGKLPIPLNEVFPGFLLNRMLSTISREAAYIAGEGWASPQDIDKAVINTFGPLCPIGGPYAISDACGLKRQKELANILGPELCSSPTYAAEFLQKYVDEGKLGVKSGEGIYKWGDTAAVRAQRDFMILQTIPAADKAQKKFTNTVSSIR